jgi:hypothetical protein
MDAEEKQIQQKISEIWATIDTFLSFYDNSLLLFDFTTVSRYKGGGIKIKSIYQFKIKHYPDKLKEYFDDHGYSIPSSSDDEPALHSMLESDPVILSESVGSIYDPGTVSNTDIGDIDSWHKFVEEKRIAGQCWTLFKHLFDNNKSKERIEVGVYLLLKDSFSQNEKSANEVKRFIHYEVLKFLWDKGLEYFANGYLEKIKDNNDIERLRNVSASTHVIKTTINGLFAPSLNSLLLEDNVDQRIKELQTAKEKFIKYAEVINLMSKLSSPFEDESEVKYSLIRSELFTKEKKDLVNIQSVLNEIKALRERDPIKTKITFVPEDIGGLSENAFVYAGTHYPAKSFYELLLLTIIENVVEHGADDDGKLTVTINLSEMEITFRNKPKPNSKIELGVESMTGNFRVFHTILNKLELGEFNVSNDTNEFKVTLKAKENG